MARRIRVRSQLGGLAVSWVLHRASHVIRPAPLSLHATRQSGGKKRGRPDVRFHPAEGTKGFSRTTARIQEAWRALTVAVKGECALTASSHREVSEGSRGGVRPPACATNPPGGGDEDARSWPTGGHKTLAKRGSQGPDRGPRAVSSVCSSACGMGTGRGLPIPRACGARAIRVLGARVFGRGARLPPACYL